MDGVLGSGTGGQSDGTKDGEGGRGGGSGGEGDGDPISTTQWLARRHGVQGRRIMYDGRSTNFQPSVRMKMQSDC